MAGRHPVDSFKISFVCTGNICRSPTAEAVFRKYIAHTRHDVSIVASSSGTAGHVGWSPDYRTVKAAAKRGYSMEHMAGRALQRDDFIHFDLLLALDSSHLNEMRRICPKEHHHKLKLLMDFSTKYPHADVPDPYYEDDAAFETVLDMVEEVTPHVYAHVAAYLDKR